MLYDEKEKNNDVWHINAMWLDQFPNLKDQCMTTANVSIRILVPPGLVMRFSVDWGPSGGVPDGLPLVDTLPP